MKRRWVIAAVLVAALFITAGFVFGQGRVDSFLKIDGIKGESQDAKHKNEIDVLSWSWGETQSCTVSRGGVMSAAKANFQDFRFTMYPNSASVLLFGASAAGRHIKNAILTVRRGVDKFEFYKITFTDIIVSSYLSELKVGLPLIDQVSLYYGAVQFEYGPVKEGWDLRKNTKF